MAPKLLFDLSTVDLSRVEDDVAGIQKYNPQRFEFQQLDGIIYYNEAEGVVVGYKDARPDEFWVRGHIPGRPLLPGVLMCEAAAQLCSYFFKRATQTPEFVGFGGIDKVKFRGPVVPGDRFLLIAKRVELVSRRAIFDVQGIVNGKIVYEGQITGIRM